MYKSAILGCRPRARKHADAYAFVRKTKLVAACDLDQGLVDQFAADHDLPAAYTDLHEMLGLYASAIHGKPIELPYRSDECLLDALKARPE